MKQIYITQLTEHLGKEIQESFYLKNIKLKHTKDSVTPYLRLDLQDKTGRINGRIWEANIEEIYSTLKGKVVTVYGQIVRSKTDYLEFIIWKMEPTIDYDITSFINGLTKIETEKYFTSLTKQISLVKHTGFHELLQLVIAGAKERLLDTPASLTQVGCYNGGLLVKIVSIASICIQILRSQILFAYNPSLKIPYNEDLLITSAILADIGTTNLYSPFPDAQKINEYALLSKNILSIQVIEHHLKDMNVFLSIEDINLLYHMIQIAHGSEYLKPMTREAVILNMAHITYERLTIQEFYLTEHQGRNGAIFIPKGNNYLYLAQNSLKGGLENDSQISQ